MLTKLYIFNATLLLLHEIESGFEKEWEILKLPGKITGFLIIHVPIILILFYGLLEIDKGTKTGSIIGIISGIGGLVPFWVHKVFVYKREHFNKAISNVIIYLNLLAGAGVLILVI
ncbi:MAG: hypothetical protein Q8930_15665 [Bacillota bacterium]|nr:hypothetical protein [Bacillota bacterium]